MKLTRGTSIGLAAIGFVLVACAGPESAGPRPSGPPSTPREALRRTGAELPPPRISDRDVVTFVAGSRHVEEQAAIARILARMPSPADREFMRRSLTDPRVHFHSSPDPVVADDLVDINQIRALDVMAHRRDNYRLAARQSGAILTLALSLVAVPGSPSALIVRPAGEFKHDIIVLTDSESTDLLATAIGDLQALRAQFGDVPEREQRLSIRQPAPQLQISATTRAKYAHFLSDLRQATPTTLPGFGTMKLIRIRLAPVGVSPSSQSNP